MNPSQSDTPETDANSYPAATLASCNAESIPVVHREFARKLELERNEAHALLRRIARKGEFMDREGLRITVADWLARRHLSAPKQPEP